MKGIDLDPQAGERQTVIDLSLDSDREGAGQGPKLHLKTDERISKFQIDFNWFSWRTDAIKREVNDIKMAKEQSRHGTLVALNVKNAFNFVWYPKIQQLWLG